ncbi:putative transmembrane protein [Bacteroides phage crAss002]|uniref:Putative transmembrane protein n=1 Tax=Bacteroides phage crAss002 TaxID=2709317 RepID=A0A7S5QT51_9CAUD|nr:putative transmembrane protein [Bacteroides phage crAss002]QIG59140.1 putative transmembrane protein [Bacteroides phage crAss002]DAT98773.1 MAG TPA: hypothetical protein [Crassvirales sp.]
MRTINNRRPKAFIGAAISVGTQLIGGIIGGAKRRKAKEAARLEQERQTKLQAAQQQASYMTENAENDANVYKNIRNQLMRNGGNIPRKGVPLIAEGGTAIPIKKDSFLLKGRKHNTGGIIIGKGKNSIEAEGDEVVQITPKQLKVFSAQPILNGNSPAELVQKGAEPSKVFNAQESFKDRNGLNDDGTKKKRNMRTITGKKKLGGLSRKKDYDSDKKPYPSVKSNDFAGGGRSYPIPTKADARDALRLAGLHGRSDVKAKVYKKYPELKNKKAVLGTLGSLTGANRRLLALNQNVPSAGITAGAKIINPSASSIKPMNLSSNNGSKGFNLFKGIDKGEAISAGIGAAGTLISGLLNKGSINKTSAPQVPTPQLIAPAKLKTSININPQLSDVRESELSQNRLVEGNTASSVASVARQQRISNNALSQRSRLRGEKENLETQLQNQDAMNRQQVASANAQQVNEANRFNAISAIQTANDKVQAAANNRTQMIEGITSAVRDYQLGVDKRRSEENAIAAMMSANPEQMELFLKLMEKNKGRLGNIRSTLFRCGGKKKIA